MRSAGWPNGPKMVSFDHHTWIVLRHGLEVNARMACGGFPAPMVGIWSGFRAEGWSGFVVGIQANKQPESGQQFVGSDRVRRVIA
jgi:hypothetical protein